MSRVGGRSGTASGGGRRSVSSRRWLERQWSDPYVIEAQRRGFRSRAAFKLIELDDRFRLLHPGDRVVDLGAAPGGWTQVAVHRTGAGAAGGGRVIAVDLLEIEPIAGAQVLRLDFLSVEAPQQLYDALGGQADVVLCDLAPNTIGQPSADHLRIVALAEAAFEFAREVLAPGGRFVCKVRQGGTEGVLLARIKRAFAQVRHAKPPASRKESAEIYLVASGYRGEGGGAVEPA